MKNKIIILSLMMLLVLPLVFAETEIYPINQNVDLKFTCTLNNAIPSAGTEYNITISYPNGSTFLNNVKTTSQGNGAFNYTTQFNTLGIYKIQMFCYDGVYSFSNEGIYEITQNGTKPDSAGGIIYLIVIIISFILFLACVIWCFNTPYKFLKLGLGLFSYILLTWIIFIIWQMSYNYLNVNSLTEVLRLFFIITTIGMFPAFILTFLIILKEIKDDIWEKKLLERGIMPNG